MAERDIPEVVDNSVEKTENHIIEHKRLESLLFEDTSSSPMVDHTVQQSTRVIGGRKKNPSGLLIILLLLLPLFFAVGYFYLSNIEELPAAQTIQYVSAKIPVPVRPKENLSIAVTSPSENILSIKTKEETPLSAPFIDNTVPLYIVTVGPFINAVELRQAIALLQELGMQPREKKGRGQVSMIRLFEGVYPEPEARIHLKELKKVVKSAFLLPAGDKLAVYTGSFHHESQARKMQDELVDKMINVSLVDSEVTMNGTMLIALQADKQTASEVLTHISSLGLHTQMIEKK